MYSTALKYGSLLLLVFSAPVLGESHTHAGDHLPTGVTTLSTDTYTLAPLVQDADTAFYSTDLGGPSQHTFDSVDESGGLNLLGSDSATFRVSEEAITTGPETLRIVVKVTALDADDVPEPWVDGSNTGNGYIAWRVDVGSTAGGSNPIEPGVPFTLKDSGFEVFNSAGTLTGSYGLTTDTSTETSLSGVAVLGNEGQEIAGVDISSIHLFWEIATADPDAVFKDGFE